MKKILILSSNKTGYGHKSIGDALAEQFGLMPDAEAEVIEALRLFGRLGVTAGGVYGPMTRMRGDFWKRLWDVSAQSPKAVVRMIEPLLHDRFMQRLKNDPPGLIVSIHPMFNAPVINVLRSHGIEIPFITLLADIVDIHPMWVDSRADYIMCPGDESFNAALALGAAASNIKLCGFPTRERFVKAARGRERENFKGDRPLECLIMSGGEGSGNLFGISKTLLENIDCRITVICGRNTKLRRSLCEKLKNYGERARVLGFCENIEDYMLEADIAIMRGSPNSMMEAVVCNTPLVITGSLSGQEARNPEFALMHGLGMVCRERRKLLPIIRGLIENGAEGLNRIAEKQRAYRNFGNAADIAAFLAGQALDKPPVIPPFEPRFPVLFQAAELYRRLESRK